MRNKIHKLLGLGFLVTLVAISCRKIEFPQPQIIDLGVKSVNTNIKSVSRVGNVFTTEFHTTPDAKYSVQIIPFGTDVVVRKDGFTASDTVTKRIYNLSDLQKMDYDLIFIDVNGVEVKYPIVIK